MNLSYIPYIFPSMPTITNIASESSKVTIGVSVSVLTAGILSSPSFLWALMSSKDIIAYLPLNRFSYTENIIDTLPKVSALNSAFNPGKYIFSLSSKRKPYLEARHFDIKTSYFLCNCGMWFAFFFLYVSMIPLLYIGTYIKKEIIRKKCQTLLSNYRYSFFLRFWVQAYTNIGFLSIIQLRSVKYI